MTTPHLEADREQQHERAHTANRRIMRQLEDQVANLRSAELALHVITRQLGITLEPDGRGHYDATILQAQVADALERRQADLILEALPIPSILTASGLPFPLTYPSSRLIDDDDIAQALSRICRFGGHTRKFYSVAQHCVLASELVPPEDALAALLHDAPEAYIGDMVSPLKAMLPAFQHIEERIWLAIAERFGIDPVMPASVKTVDLQLLATERRDLLPASPQVWPCLQGIDPLPDRIEPWSPEAAALAWGLRLDELTAQGEVSTCQP